MKHTYSVRLSTDELRQELDAYLALMIHAGG